MATCTVITGNKSIELLNVKKNLKRKRKSLCLSSSCPDFCTCKSNALLIAECQCECVEDRAQAWSYFGESEGDEHEENAKSDEGEKEENTVTSNLWNFHRKIVPNRKVRSDLDPRHFHRFYQLDCSNCGKSWSSPLTKAEVGLFCPTCSTFIRPSTWKDYATPYIGPHLCFGQFRCHRCASTWNSQRSVSHSGQVCYSCGTLNFPLRQMPILQKLEQWRRNAETLEAYKLSQPYHPEVKEDESVIYPPDEKLGPPAFRARWNVKKVKGREDKA